ncbi:Lar family restriction alleviation protein [Herbaspirillum sp. SJZ107]|uniref:Lar family restriction alleviation protein n=1 Tax=Herbaspirillum sp. SJZ107 TaxID=2572881 RepID=UPI0011684355|nr:Lar family restriction alleviation protein [Herbaspirillum sp. SJZ107]TQK10192.1 restriction alleviation protein Lar [Herbaspirillum sp. SJZ107]
MTNHQTSPVGEDAALLPCPFCGGTDTYVERLDYSAAYVQCDSRIDEHCACLARGPVGVQDDDGEEIPGAAAAIRAWNEQAARRAAPTQPKAQVGSIDTPEFSGLLADFGHNWTNGDEAQKASRAAIIAHIDALAGSRAGDAVRLLRESRAVLETWKDIVPAVSLCADIDKVLVAAPDPGKQAENDQDASA